MRLLSIGLLCLVAGALADKKLTYSCRNKNGGINKSGKDETKAGGTISDDFADKILDKIEDWSDGKYQAKQNRIGRDLVTIVCKDAKDNQVDALAAVADQQSIVNKHKDD